jgi:hypothetical protein
MTASEVAKAVLEDGCKLVRETKVEHVKGMPWQYDVKDFTGSKGKGWFYFDSFTAGAVNAVFEALNADNQAKFDMLPLSVLVGFAFRNVN